MTESSDYESVQVFIGVDVGKDTHHAVAINRSGKRLFDKALPNDENKLRSLISDLKQHGQILLVVDQPVKRRTKNAKAFHDKCENFSFRASNETAVLITAFYSLHGDHLGYG